MNYQSVRNIVDISQDVLIIAAFIGIVLFIFMIYVGACIIRIKNDVKILTDLEIKKCNEKKERKESSGETNDVNKEVIGSINQSL